MNTYVKPTIQSFSKAMIRQHIAHSSTSQQAYNQYGSNYCPYYTTSIDQNVSGSTGSGGGGNTMDCTGPWT